MNDSGMLALSLTEAAGALARGEISSVRLTQAAIDRAKGLGPALNCIAVLDAEEALHAAEKADRDRNAGKSVGKLHGVPLAHKDLFYRKGKVVACGSKIRKDFVPGTTATVLERLQAAGAVTLGALHMAEFAFSPTGYNEHYRPRPHGGRGGHDTPQVARDAARRLRGPGAQPHRAGTLVPRHALLRSTRNARVACEGVRRDKALKNVDVLHLPAIPIPVPTIEETTSGNAADVARVIGVVGHCRRGINYLGLPAVSVPAGFDSRGLPVAFQLVGRPFSEAMLLRGADACQRVTDWHRRSPAIVDSR